MHVVDKLEGQPLMAGEADARNPQPRRLLSLAAAALLLIGAGAAAAAISTNGGAAAGSTGAVPISLANVVSPMGSEKPTRKCPGKNQKPVV